MAFNYDCGTWSLSWPYPQMHVGKYRTLAFANATDFLACYGSSGGSGLGIYELRNDGTDWNAYAMFLLTSVSGLSQISIASFGSSDVISFFSEASENVRTFLFYPGYVYSYIWDNYFPALGYPSGISVCNFKGRCVLGGVYNTQAPWNELGFSSVAWSAPGQLEFNPSNNAGAGFAQLPLDDNGKGYIYSVKRQENQVIAYGKFGVCGLIPYSNDIATGFGIKETSQPGTLSGGMVGGDDHVHLYIDDRGDSWLVSGKMEFKKLGYREFFAPMVATQSASKQILISYVPGRKRFYISNDSVCYVLTEFGLYESHQLTTGANLYHDTLVGFFDDNEDYSWQVKTGKLDFGLRALKTLETVEVGGRYRLLSGETPLEINVAVDHNYNYNSSGFTSLAARRLNPTGFVFPQVTSNEFRVKVSGTDYRSADMRLDYLSMGVKLVDKRGIRRIYGNVNQSNA